eukprot:6421844-Amphidinium_carterae.1
MHRKALSCAGNGWQNHVGSLWQCWLSQPARSYSTTKKLHSAPCLPSRKISEQKWLHASGTTGEPDFSNKGTGLSTSTGVARIYKFTIRFILRALSSKDYTYKNSRTMRRYTALLALPHDSI